MTTVAEHMKSGKWKKPMTVRLVGGPRDGDEVTIEHQLVTEFEGYHVNLNGSMGHLRTFHWREV